MSSTAVTTEPKTNQKITNHNIRQKLSYLVSPQGPNQPAKLRTRTILKTLHYVTVCIFWRALRTLRYAIAGSLIAAVAGSALGPLVGGAAFFLAPPGILAGAGVGVLWALARFRWRKFRKTVKEGGKDGTSARSDEKSDAENEHLLDSRQKRALDMSNRQFDPLNN